MVIPFASIDYNLARIYQQLLIFLSIPIILGAYILLKLVNKKIAKALILIIYINFFITYTGLLNAIIGGRPAIPELSSYGTDYERFHISGRDVNSIKWLTINYKLASVFADEPGAGKLTAFSNNLYIDKNQLLLPNIIDKNSYVYLSSENILTDNAYAWIKGSPIKYKIPYLAIRKHANLVYSNGGVKILK